MRAIRIAALAHIVGWVKRDTGTFFVGFAYPNVPQQSETASRLANPTRSAADHRLNPTTIYRLGLQSGYTFYLTFGNNKWINLALVPMATASNNARRHPAPDDRMERRWPSAGLRRVALDTLIRLIRFFNYFCKSLATKARMHKKGI